MIKRAILSVSDKTGIVDLARRLAAKGVTLLSTGGTQKAIADAGIPVTGVSDVTGFPECLEGGLDMDKDALIASGVNQSATHVDFMIGSDDLNITGVKSSGEEVSVFCNGAWAWESE